jgi:V/A-type H+-transporting ATPase subunit C
MAVKNTDFLDASAFLRVQEKRLLGNAGLERVIDAPNAAEALRMLSQNSDYDFAGLKDPAEYEDALKAELRRIYALAYRLAKENSAVVDVLASRYDYHNIKTAVKAAHFKQRTENPYVLVTDVSPAAIEAQVAEPKDRSGLPEHLVKAIAAAQEDFARTGNPQSIDIAVDKAMFAHMLGLCEKLGVDFITEYTRMAVDFHNIKTLLRVKAMRKGTAFLSEALAEGGKTPISFFAENYAKTPSAMVPTFYYKYFGDAMRAGIEHFERSGNLSQLERLFDNMLIKHTKAAKYVSFGPEILFAYIVSKENEIRQVRILCTCKLNSISAEALRERLRDNYA